MRALSLQQGRGLNAILRLDIGVSPGEGLHMRKPLLHESMRRHLYYLESMSQEGHLRFSALHAHSYLSGKVGGAMTRGAGRGRADD